MTLEDSGNEKYRWQLGGGLAEYDEAAELLSVRGEPVPLEPRSSQLLQLLLRRHRELVPHADILKTVWRTPHVSENAIANIVSKLRAALKGIGDLSLENVPRRGYRLLGDVHCSVVKVDFSRSTRLLAGQILAERPDLTLTEALAATADGDVWTANAANGAVCVLKLPRSELGLARLRFQAAQAHRLADRLGDRPDLIDYRALHLATAPYFAEVRYGGLNLRAWYAAQGASHDRAARIQLIVQAATTLAAAHGVGVLHHGLKPENVLIAGTPDAWRVSLADFGMERVWHPDAPATEAQALAGNTLYLAPELLAGARASAASDVYALGVLLYQLAFGDFGRALAPGWERDIDDELLRADIAHATDIDPTRRMATAEQLLRQLRTLDERRLALQQQRARDAEQAAIAAALARARARRPWLVLAGLGLLSIAAISLIEYRAAERGRLTAERSAAAAETARHAAVQANLEAERYRDSTAAVQDFLLSEILAQTDPTDPRYQSKADQRQIIDNAAAAIEKRFSQDSLARATMHQEVGSVYKALALREETRKHLRRAIELFTEALGADHDRTLGARYNLAHAESLEGKFAEAGHLLDETDQLAGARLNSPTRLAVLAAAARGEVATMQFKPSEAVPYYEKALALVAQGAVIDSHRLEVVQDGLADALTRLNRQDEALQILNDMLSREAELRPTTRADIRRQLTRIHRNQGNYALALIHGEKGVQLSDEIYGPEHVNAVFMLSTASYLHEVVGDCKKGLSTADDVYRRISRNYSETEQMVLIELGNRGSRRVNCGEPESGIADARRARDLLRKHYGPDNFAAMSFTLAYIRGLGKLGRFDEAFPELATLEAQAAGLPTTPGGSVAWVPQLFALYRAELLRGQGKHLEARAVLEPAITQLRASGVDPNLLAESEKLQRELALAAAEPQAPR